MYGDIPRVLAKLNVSLERPGTPSFKATQKSLVASYYVMYKHTPIIGPFIERLVKMYHPKADDVRLNDVEIEDKTFTHVPITPYARCWCHDIYGISLDDQYRYEDFLCTMPIDLDHVTDCPEETHRIYQVHNYVLQYAQENNYCP